MNPRPWLSAVWLAGVLLILMDPLSSLPARWALAAEDDSPRSAVHVTVDGGLLTVDARNAPLADVLRAIAERAGFWLTLRGDLSRAVTWSFTGVPLDQSIRWLAGDNGLVMIYAPTGGEAGERLLRDVRVYGLPNGRVVTIEPVPQENSLDRVYQDLAQRDRVTRLRFVRSLAREATVSATDDLASVLAKEKDSAVRRVAAMGLGEIGGTEAVAALTAALGDKNRLIRILAIHGLGKIGGEESPEVLMPALADEDASVRIQAMLALHKVGGVGTAGVLGEVAVKDPDPEVRRATVRILGKLGSDEAWQPLQDATTDPDLAVRLAAEAALERLRGLRRTP